MDWMYLVLAAFGGFMVGGTFGLLLGCVLAMAGRESRVWDYETRREG